jgi:glycogen debranching enzyme
MGRSMSLQVRAVRGAKEEGRLMAKIVDPAVHMEMIRRRAMEYRRPAKVESTVETRVIKENDLFMLMDVEGNIPLSNNQGLGLYLRDTRFLSGYELRVAGVQPTVLHSSAEKNCLLSVDLTNPDIGQGDAVIPAQTININRSRLVYSAIQERISFLNYNGEPVELDVEFSFDADYLDIFEVRGYKTRARRGEMLPEIRDERSLTLRYMGLDNVERRTEIRFLQVPDSIEGRTASFHLHLEPHQQLTLELVITPREGDEERRVVGYNDARYALEQSYSGWLQQNTYVGTSSDLFDTMLQRSILDLRLLMVESEFGPIVTAGTPWYACAFGRDGLITALQSLMFCPDLARAMLRLLAHYQGTEVNPDREEEPGKIFHELRRGEMARLGEVPHTPYYGTADATPLWLVLLYEAYRWTGDSALVGELWDNALRALEWIDRYGDADGDGYVEYQCNSPSGLINHGWKDSAVSVFDGEGELSEQPTALVEIQGYVYHAKCGMAELAMMRGETELADRLRAEAETLRRNFNRDYWMEDRHYFAFALDGQKRQVKTITSNPGQALWSGIAEPSLARRMVQHFKSADLLSGWGVRCVADSETGYNPMGYHLGTVWPFDVSLLVSGLRKYGFTQEAITIGTQLYRAGLEFLYYRFPEVFTGFSRSHNPFPVPYPVSCTPQAWSAGTTLLLLQTFLGITAEAGHQRVTLDPALPPWLDEVRVSNLHIGDATLDLLFMLRDKYSTVQVLKKDGPLDVLI